MRDSIFLKKQLGKNMTKKKLVEKLKLHTLWLGGNLFGVRLILCKANLICVDLSGTDLREADLRRANLSRADLSWADLSWADLSKANLSGTDLRDADLRRANLSKADLSKVNLSGANLSKANLSKANLIGADLSRADLRGADLNEANLSGANLIGSNLDDAKLSEAIGTEPAPEGELIGWKKLRDDVICKLRIPADAKRSRATTNKHRAEYAIVLEGEGVSMYYRNFEYKVGKTVWPELPFDKDRWNECASGIHFFLTRKEAEEYVY